jgi:Uma2 family endonuclease
MSTIALPNIEAGGLPGAPTVSAMPSAPVKVHVPILIDGEILIPGWVVDHESYRRWARSDEFPERGRFSFIDGMIWVDRTMEEFFSHNHVKTVFTGVLGPLVWNADTGYFGCDGNLWSHAEAEISTEPDSMFFTYEALQSGRVRLVEGAKRGYVEVEGSPNMVLEIVSDSSVKKDTQVLKEKYAKAGVDEYWLVDARGTELLFEIWRLRDAQYVPTQSDNGWLTSAIYGHAFKLEQGKDRLGHPRFQLMVR